MARYLGWPIAWSVMWTAVMALGSRQQSAWETALAHCIAAGGMYVGASIASGGGRTGRRSGAAWAAAYGLFQLVIHSLAATGTSLESGPSGPILLLACVAAAGSVASALSGSRQLISLLRAGLACVVGVWIAALGSYVLGHIAIRLMLGWLPTTPIEGIAVALSGACAGAIADLLAGAGMRGGITNRRRAEAFAS